MKKFILIIACFVSSIAVGQTAIDASSLMVDRIPNNVSSGTIISNLAKIDTSGTLIVTTTADTNIPVYLVVGNAGTTGNAKVATSGIATCIFDTGGGTAGHFVITSTATAGLCRDGGASIPQGVWIIGQLLSSPASGGLNAGAVLLSKGAATDALPCAGPVCCTTPLASAGTTVGPLAITSGSKLLVPIIVTGYAGADAASLVFNTTTGTTNYRYRWMTSSAAAGTTFAAGLVATATDRIKIGAVTTTNSRNVDAVINNLSSITEKNVMFVNGMFGTGSAGTQDSIDIGNGAWISAASTTITTISLLSTSNMNVGSFMCAYKLMP